MRKPIVQVIGQTGTDLVPGWGSSLTRISITDNEGSDADEIEMEFSVSPPFQAPPAEGTKYRVFYGWDAGRLRDAGLFTSQKPRLSGDADGGALLTIGARSADFIDADKEADSEHFDDTTAGAIFTSLAARAGKSAIVHPSVASVSIPYRLRFQQSAVGFAQALADELGGALKLAGGKWLVSVKGGGETASGGQMPAIVVSFDEAINFDLESDGHPKFKTVDARWFDAGLGVNALASASGIGSAARAFFLHPAPSEKEAASRAKAEALELARMSVTGSVEIIGRVDAMAGAPVDLDGFDAWGGYDLVASSISHEITFDESGGWLMTIELTKRKAA